MSQSSLSNLFFAILIFVTHLNCVVEHQLFAPADGQPSLHHSDWGNRQSLPISGEQSEHACHDVGCICKGATLVDHFFVQEPDLCRLFCFPAELLPGFLQPADLELILELERPSKILRPPLRALQRCIILQSFQI